MLNQIVKKKYEQIAQDKQHLSMTELIRKVTVGTFAFSRAIENKDWNLIAECKQASPAKGRLSQLGVGQLAKIYEANGATALSVLTDSHFCGDIQHIQEVKAVSKLPILRKDFIIDEYQILQARLAEADAVLLIAAILDDRQIELFLALAKDLKMDCLVEVHSLTELMRVQQSSARIIGINNRDLTTFSTNLQITHALIGVCQPDRIVISESGIKNKQDVNQLKQAGVSGALVGEGLVTAEDIAQKVRELSLNDGEEMLNAK